MNRFKVIASTTENLSTTIHMRRVFETSFQPAQFMTQINDVFEMEKVPERNAASRRLNEVFQACLNNEQLLKNKFKEFKQELDRFSRRQQIVCKFVRSNPQNPYAPVCDLPEIKNIKPKNIPENFDVILFLNYQDQKALELKQYPQGFIRILITQTKAGEGARIKSIALVRCELTTKNISNQQVVVGYEGVGASKYVEWVEGSSTPEIMLQKTTRRGDQFEIKCFRPAPGHLSASSFACRYREGSAERLMFIAEPGVNFLTLRREGVHKTEDVFEETHVIPTRSDIFSERTVASGVYEQNGNNIPSFSYKFLHYWATPYQTKERMVEIGTFRPEPVEKGDNGGSLERGIRLHYGRDISRMMRNLPEKVDVFLSDAYRLEIDLREQNVLFIFELPEEDSVESDSELDSFLIEGIGAINYECFLKTLPKIIAAFSEKHDTEAGYFFDIKQKLNDFMMRVMGEVPKLALKEKEFQSQLPNIQRDEWYRHQQKEKERILIEEEQRRYELTKLEDEECSALKELGDKLQKMQSNMLRDISHIESEHSNIFKQLTSEQVAMIHGLQREFINAIEKMARLQLDHQESVALGTLPDDIQSWTRAVNLELERRYSQRTDLEDSEKSVRQEFLSQEAATRNEFAALSGQEKMEMEYFQAKRNLLTQAFLGLEAESRRSIEADQLSALMPLLLVQENLIRNEIESQRVAKISELEKEAFVDIFRMNMMPLATGRIQEIRGNQSRTWSSIQRIIENCKQARDLMTNEPIFERAFVKGSSVFGAGNPGDIDVVLEFKGTLASLGFHVEKMKVLGPLLGQAKRGYYHKAVSVFVLELPLVMNSANQEQRDISLNVILTDANNQMPSLYHPNLYAEINAVEQGLNFNFKDDSSGYIGVSEFMKRIQERRMNQNVNPSGFVRVLGDIAQRRTEEGLQEQAIRNWLQSNQFRVDPEAKIYGIVYSAIQGWLSEKRPIPSVYLKFKELVLKYSGIQLQDSLDRELARAAERVIVSPQSPTTSGGSTPIYLPTSPSTFWEIADKIMQIPKESRPEVIWRYIRAHSV